MFKKILTPPNLFLLIILAIAAFMRLYKIADYLTFLGDEGRDVLVVYNILHGHFTLLGPTASVGGFFLGPIYYYFMAPFLWLFNYSPIGPGVMIALFGIVTVWLVYYIANIFFNKKAAIIAAFLYAIAPVVILYSRSSWNPNLMPITTLVLLYLLYLGVKTNRTWKFLLSGFLFGIAMQLHYIEVFVGVTIILYIVGVRLYQYIEREYTSFPSLVIRILKDYAFIGIGFVVGFSPFLAFEVRHGFNNIRAILDFVFHAKTSGDGVGLEGNVPAAMVNVFFRIFSRLVVNIPSPDLYGNYPSWVIQLWTLSSWLLGIASSGFLVFSLIINWKKREKFLQYFLLLLWLGIGVFFFGFYKKNIYDYYFEFLFPLPFLLVGGLFSFLLSRNILLKITMVIILVVLAAVNLQGIPFRYPGNRQLQQTEIISRFVLDKANGQPFNFALITAGNSDHAYRYFFTVWGHSPVTIQYPGVDPRRTSVTSQLLVVCEEACMPLGNSLWEIAGFGRAEVVGQWNVSVVKVYRLVHYEQANPKSQATSNK